MAAWYNVLDQDDLDTHVAAADPHTVYQRESEKNAASGYAGLDSGTKLDVAQIPVASRKRQFAFTISAPAVGGIPGPRVPWACTITRLGSYTTAGTVTFNIEDRTTIGSAGTNILSSDQVADTTGEEVTSSFNKSSMAAGEYVFVDISAVSTPGTVTIWLEVEV